MSIYVEIINRVNEGRLFTFSPTIGPSIRRIVVSKDIHELLYGAWISSEWEDRRMGLRADMDHFMQGGLITVALPNKRKPYERKDVKLRLLHPWRDEVWEIRSTHSDPDMSIRIFGRFAAIDYFVALSWAKRPYLDKPTSPQWRAAKARCKTEWNNLFHPYQPCIGVNLHAYISKSVLI